MSSTAPTWYIGPVVSVTVLASYFHCSAWIAPNHVLLPCVHTAPFGRPVVPDVYMSIAGSAWDGRATSGSVRLAVRSRSHPVAQSGIGGSPRTT